MLIDYVQLTYTCITYLLISRFTFPSVFVVYTTITVMITGKTSLYARLHCWTKLLDPYVSQYYTVAVAPLRLVYSWWISFSQLVMSGHSITKWTFES